MLRTSSYKCLEMNCLKSMSSGNVTFAPRKFRAITLAFLHSELKLLSSYTAEAIPSMCVVQGVNPSSRLPAHRTSSKRRFATGQIFVNSEDGCHRKYNAIMSNASKLRHQLGSYSNLRTGSHMRDFHTLSETSVLDLTSEVHSRRCATHSLATMEHNVVLHQYASSALLRKGLSSWSELLPQNFDMPLSSQQRKQYPMQYLHTSSSTAAVSPSSELLSKSSAVPSVSSDHQQQQCNVHCGSASGMSGIRTPTFGDVFSEENKARVMTNLSRKTLRRFFTRDMKERGAVLVPLCSVNQEPCVLFTLRSRMLKDHSGEVSFPGGKMDHTDKDVSHTALREMEEELGIDPRMVEVWGNLAPLGRERISVVPVIGYLGELDVGNIRFNTSEVSAVFVMTLSQLCSPECQAYTVYEPHVYSGMQIAALPVFVGGEHRVWGLTAIILDMALQAIVPDHYQSLVKKVQREVQRQQSAS